MATSRASRPQRSPEHGLRDHLGVSTPLFDLTPNGSSGSPGGPSEPAQWLSTPLPEQREAQASGEAAAGLPLRACPIAHITPRPSNGSKMPILDPAILEYLSSSGDSQGPDPIKLALQNISDLEERYRYTIEYSHMAIQARFNVPQPALGGGDRRGISRFTEESRRRLFRFVSSVEFDRTRFLFMTLTYPRKFPRDGRVCKRHLDAFLKRWDRKFGPIQCVWKLEFQRRGAPHYHLMVTRPKGYLIKEVRRLVSMWWFQVVCSSDPNHYDRGTQTDVYRRSDPAIYFAGHAKKTDHYQNRVPKSFKNVGRFWGVRRLRRDPKKAVLNRDQYMRLRRIIRNYKKSFFPEYRQRSKVLGYWGRLRSGEKSVEKLLRYLGVMCESQESESLSGRIRSVCDCDSSKGRGLVRQC